ncbi:hypothetical protein FOZ62_003975, partial [Perkinsus olseni]
PEEHFAEFQELVREKKRQYADIRGEFIRELRVEFPHASLMRLEAMARRLLDEKLLSDEKEQLSQVKSLLDQDPENAEIKEVSWLGSVFGVEEIYEQLKDTVNILEESEKQKE